MITDSDIKKAKKKVDEDVAASTVVSSAESVLTPPSDASPALSVSPDTKAAGAPAVATEPEPSVATATADLTDKGRSPMTQLIALLPVEKQAEGSSLVLDLVKQAREQSAPFDPNKSTLALARGRKYRRSERSPKGDANDKNA